MRLGDVTFDAEGGEKGVEWAGGGGFDHSILIRFKRFIQNPFALSLSKGRSCLEGRKKTVLRQPRITSGDERMRGQFSIWKVRPALAVKIGRAHVWTQVTNAHLVCRLLLEKKNK